MSPRHRKLTHCSRCGQEIVHPWLNVSRFTWTWGWRTNQRFCRKCSMLVQLLLDELVKL